MSEKSEMLWALGLIIRTVQRLNNPRGSRVSEIILDMVKGTRGETDTAVFEEQCKQFEKAFYYGFQLNIFVPDADCERYKIRMSASAVSKFLKSLNKSPEPKPVEEQECNPKVIFLEIDSDSDDLDYDRFKVVEKRRVNRSVTDLQTFAFADSSDESSCEII